MMMRDSLKPRRMVKKPRFLKRGDTDAPLIGKTPLAADAKQLILMASGIARRAANL
jgi:hypothetical protein